MVLNPFDIHVKTKKPTYEVADALREFGEAYEQKYGLTQEQAQVVKHLTECRTVALGVLVDECNECGALTFSYPSCGDRHCPKCGKFKKAQWVAKQKQHLLPIPYFHITFTTDHALNPLIVANRKVIYDALFWSVKRTLELFARDELGGDLGFTLVLHTWGQQLDPHVHVHCISTGGALSFDGKYWHKSGRRYLFDVVKLSAAYRDRFCRKLKRLYQAGKLKLVGQCQDLDVEKLVEAMLGKAWEVFIKAFDDPGIVYQYLSRYVHAVAISNYRIIEIAEGKVSFSYHDNKDKDEITGQGKPKVLTLDGVEFVRRFLWHVLPPGFRRIRHYGLHHHTAYVEKLSRARQLLGLSLMIPEAEELDLTEWLKGLGLAGDRCWRCGAEGSMFRRAEYKEVPWFLMTLLSLKGLSLGAPVEG